MSYGKERQIAIEAVLNACRLCQRVQADLVTADTITKKDKSPVTIADFGAQAIVNLSLMAAFPDDPIVGEEDATTLREQADLRQKVVHHVQQIRPNTTEDHILDAIDYGTYAGGANGRFWTIDPIDGTKGFLRKDQYAVALGLVENGDVVLGVLGCPNLPFDLASPHRGKGCLFVAVKGQGTVMRHLSDDTERPVHVSDIDDSRQAAFCESVESAHSDQQDSAKIAQLLHIDVPPVRIDSQCKYGIVARGEASIYLRLPTRADYQEKIWDHAAGYRVVTEAGGQVSDVDGKPLDFSHGRKLTQNTGVIVTNGRLHDRVIAAVKQVLNR
ncbi:MAG: 3'(2'),5'-bisphosphate nucleotidase [Gemmatimonadetes bacterium]|nr:MAG: 3'(2'),5'-bisphosphate nucleotidase [Gemmatimonadota bacterium]